MIAIAVVALAITVTGIRMRRSSAAFTNYMTDYSRRGGPYVHPTELDRRADIDEMLFALAICSALVLWAVVVVVIMIWLPKFRLDEHGLRWTTGYWPGWKGPIDSRDVISLRPGVETGVGGHGLAGAWLGRAMVRRTGAYRSSILYLRTDAGWSLKRLKYMNVPGRQPPDAKSYLLIRQPVLDSNPDFVRRLRN